MYECYAEKIKSAAKRKRTQKIYIGSPPNLRVRPVPSHPVKDFTMIFTTIPDSKVFTLI
jgi:hypothetical protein